MNAMKQVLLGGLLTLLAISGQVYAQQEPQFTQYTDNILYYNPAYAGSRGMMNISALHRQQWIGIDGAPMTQSFQLHTPLKYESVGLGMSVINDRIGPINQTWINADFSYSFKFRNGGKLAFGIKGGINLLNGKLNQLFTIQANDPTLEQNYVNKVAPNVGAGVYYHSKHWFIGAAVPKLIEPKLNNNAVRLIEKRHYYGMVGGYIKASRMLKIRPSAMVKITDNAPITVDGSLAFIFYDKVWLAGNYRLKEGAGLYVQLQLSHQLKVGYGCDITTSKLMRYNFGSHELMLSYDFIYKKRALASPRYF
jgi:type IX secretion system PorP/SprF family membrane protein